MIALPHMPLFVYELETDETCRLMSHAEFGLYMRLLVRQWIEGSIPGDTEDIARLVGGNTKSTARTLAKFIDDKMPVCSDGRRRNIQLASLREDKLAKVETNRANGRAGGRPPKSNAANTNEITERLSENETERLSESESESKPSGPIRASGSYSDSGSGFLSGVGMQGAGDGMGRFPLSGRWPAHTLGSLVSEYPAHRRQGRSSAMSAADRALCRIADGQDPPENPVDWLRERLRAFAASPAGNEGKFTQKPANWFDDERYLDPPEAWKTHETPNGHAKEPTTAELLATAAARRAKP